MKEFLKGVVIKILTLEAQILIWRFKPYVIMVTGSVGKTSTKDAVYTALNSFLPSVRKSQKSQNSDIGVPLTILNLNNAWSNPILWLWNIFFGLLKVIFTFNYPKYLILEVGADKPGDLANLLNWIKPNMVVATIFPSLSVHVQFYKTPDDVIKEESLPALEMPSDGILILNDDDEKSAALGKEFGVKVITYGLTPRANVSSLGDEILYSQIDGRSVPTGMKFAVSYGNNKVPFTINGAIGITQIYPVLAGIASAIALGGKLQDLANVYDDYEVPRGRMCTIPAIKGAIIIDDSYNSSPVAVDIALRTLKRVSGKRRIVALGDMRELGSYAKDEHLKVGKLVAETADILITVGILSRHIAEGALNNKMDEKNIYQFEDSEKAGKFLETILKEGDIVLVKGSQNTIFMERLVEEIMLHPEDKEKLLVRQEKEWSRR